MIDFVTINNFVKATGSSKKVFFNNSRAYAFVDRVEISVNINTDKFDGFYVMQSELKKVLSVFKTGYLIIENDTIFACSKKARKKIDTFKGTPFSLYEDEVLKMEYPGFYNMYVQCYPYASDDETRYFLMGLFVEGKDVVVATNGKKMICKYPNGNKTILENRSTENIHDEKETYLVPYRKQLLKLKNVSTNFYSSYIEFVSLDVSYKISYIEGSFPNWRRILTSTHKGYSAIKINQNCINQLVQASKFAEKPLFKVTISKNEITIINEFDKMSYVDKCIFDYCDESDFNFNINIRYLIDAINDINISYNNVKYLYFKDNEHMLYMEDDKTTIVIMPIRTN